MMQKAGYLRFCLLQDEMDVRPYTYASSVGSRVSCVSIPSTQCGVWTTALWRALQLELEQSAQPRGTAAVFLDCILYMLHDSGRDAQSAVSQQCS